MNETSPDIRRLNDTIEMLNGDAEGMHSLVTRSTEELARATEEGKRAADLAEEALKALAPVAEELRSATADAKDLLASTGKTVNGLSEEIAWAQKEGKEAFDEFASASLKAAEKTRDDLQTDLLSQKTVMAARMDSLEASTAKRLSDLEGTVTRLEEAAKGVEASLGGRIDLLQKKVSLPLYGVIAVVVLQLIALAMLALR